MDILRNRSHRDVCLHLRKFDFQLRTSELGRTFCIPLHSFNWAKMAAKLLR